MGGDRDDGFRRFVQVHRQGLLRSARLLTGDRAAADDLVRTALLQTYRRWPRAAADPRACARRVLVAAFLRRPRSPRQVLVVVPERAIDPVARRDEETWAALAGLSPRMRAVVVLRFSEDLAELEIAELLGCPPGTVATEISRAPARLGMSAASEDLESELRDRLDSAAWHGALPEDDVAAADAVIDRRRSERRNRAAVLAAAVCLGLVLVATGRWSGGPALPVATPAPPPAGGWTDPTRGSLAADEDFLVEVRGRSWDQPAGVPLPPAGERTVAFAGDVAGIRWVLVVGPAGDELTGLWFTGPAGTAPGDLQPGREDRVVPGLPVAGIHADATGATLLVVGQPGDDVEVSPAVTVDATGRVRRAYTPLDAPDGVAVIREAGAYAGVSLRYRVQRNGLLAGAGPSSAAIAAPSQVPASVPGVPALRPEAGTPSATAFSLAVEHVLAATGLGPGDVAPVLLWSGPVPAPGGTTVQGSAVVMTMPSGAVVVGTAVAGTTATDQPARDLCGSVVAPAGTAPPDVVAVVGCEVTTRSGTQRSFVVTAPAGYDRVSLRSGDGRDLGTQQLVAGSTAVPDPGTVQTAVLSGPGHAPLEVTPADPRHDALDVG